MSFEKLFICVCIFISRTSCASGQNSVFFNFRNVGFDEGLSSYNIKKIIQDKKDFMWIVSQDGVNRFDSKSIFIYKQGKGKYELDGSDIWDVQGNNNDSLVWVASNTSITAINIVDGHVIKRVSIASLHASVVQILLIKNEIWIGTDKGVATYDMQSQELHEVTIRRDSQTVNVSSMCLDRSDRIWCYSPDYGISVIDVMKKKLVYFMPNKELQFKSPTDSRLQYRLLLLEDNRILFASHEGFRTLSITGNMIKSLLGFNGQFLDEPIASYAIDEDRNLWFATASGLFRYNIATSKKDTVEDIGQNISNDNTIQDIYVDKTKTLWVATQNGILYASIKQSPFQTFYHIAENQIKIEHVYYVYADTHDDVYICTGRGFYRQNKKSRATKVISSSGMYFFCFRTPDKTLIVSASDRLFYLDGSDRLVPVERTFKELTPISFRSINSYINVNDTLLLMGSESSEGIYKWFPKKKLLLKKDSHSSICPLKSDVVNTIYKGTSHRFILSDHLMTIWDTASEGAFDVKLSDLNTTDNAIFYFDIVEIKNQFYVTVYGKGVYKFNRNFKTIEVLSEKNGLCNNGVYKIIPVGDSLLIITTNKGLSVYNLDTRSFRNYYRSDGLHSDAFEEGCAFQKDNLIYAGGVKGFTIIDPSKFTTNTVPPKVYINRIFVDRTDKSKDIDTTNLEIKTIKIPSDVLQTTLYFSGINYSNPERTTFEYRIIENNKNWVNIGTQSYLNLIGLPPGTYHLEIKAANEDGYWSTPISLELVYLPKWYQAWWFKSMLFLCCIGLGYLIYRVRMNNLLKQQQIRRDVAADLHDDIGSSLNSVKVFAHLAKGNPLHNRYIQNVEDNLEQATAGLRDMIWILDDKRDSIRDLCNRLYQHIAKPAEAIGIEVQFDIHENLSEQNLSKPVKRNLYLIAKEAINNSIKYAECRHIWVTFGLRQKRLVIKIKDDGKGFDATTVANGNGLSNIKMRAEQIHFDCTIKADTTGVLILITEK